MEAALVKALGAGQLNQQTLDPEIRNPALMLTMYLVPYRNPELQDPKSDTRLSSKQRSFWPGIVLTEKVPWFRAACGHFRGF